MQTLASARYLEVYGRSPHCVASAPGRVNIIGEHTDYNGGWVLPAPLPLLTTVALGPRQDMQVRAWSHGATPRKVQFSLAKPHPKRDWGDYVHGMCQAFASMHALPHGFDIAVHSDVPPGGGLSSSAALEIALGRALRAWLDKPCDDMALARMGQRCENDFVGAQVGIMDHMAASVAQMGELLLLDTHTMGHTQHRWPQDLGLAVLHSGVTHGHAAGAYNERRRACVAAARLLDVEYLCALSDQDLDRINRLPEPLCRRARHVVTENGRVTQALDALAQGRYAALGALLVQSHASLRDDYEVSHPAVDALVACAMLQRGCFGARITGGGFGGCMILVAPRQEARRLADNVIQSCRGAAPGARVVYAGNLQEGALCDGAQSSTSLP